MSRLGLTIHDQDIISVESTHGGAFADAHALMSAGMKSASCYFCTNDIIAFGFIRALKQLGMSIPDDVSVIGFDNLSQSATSQPPLTTVEASKRKIGDFAITVLDDLIDGAEAQPFVKIQVGAELVLRGTHSRAGFSKASDPALHDRTEKLSA